MGREACGPCVRHSFRGLLVLQVFTVLGDGQQRLGGHVEQQAILHFHGVVIDGVLDSAKARGQ